MSNLGFSPVHTGDYVTELKELLASRVEKHGLIWMGRVYYEPITKETCNDIAKKYLAWIWACDNASHKVECIDGGPWRKVTNTRTMKSRIVIKWHRVPAYLRDQFRKVKYKIGPKRKNPYA
jgi:hypothetical protein